MVAGEQELEVALPSVCRFVMQMSQRERRDLGVSPLNLLQVSSDQNANNYKQGGRSNAFPGVPPDVPQPSPPLRIHFPATGT